MRGFTIIESLVVIFVFTLLMGAASGFILSLYRTHAYAWQQSVAVDEARRGIETMVREIREAKTGADGSYPIEYAGDKEFIFYSDIDKDGDVERVRYFLGTENSGAQTQKCVTFTSDASCSVTFSDFLSGTLNSAELKVSVEGDFGSNNEYADISADTSYLDRVCASGCSDCAGVWEGTKTLDVTSEAADNSVQFTADSSPAVGPRWFCDWEENNHAMKANFEFSWTETLTSGENELKKGVTNPVGEPASYPAGQEEVTVLTSYVRNGAPIFEYFDANGNEIQDNPARLADTKIMKVFLIVNVDPNRAPDQFELESSVQLRNLKEE